MKNFLQVLKTKRNLIPRAFVILQSSAKPTTAVVCNSRLTNTTEFEKGKLVNMKSKSIFSLITNRICVAVLLLIGLGIGQVSWGQTTLLNETFGTTNAVLPTGWTSSNTTNGWNGSTASVSATYTGFSAGANVLFAATGTNGATHTLTYSNSLSTVGYTNITVLWGARGTATFSGAVPFEWSPDGTTWNAVTYTQVTYNANWALVNGGTRIALPSGAAGISNLRFRFTGTATNNGNFRIDDFTVQGTSGTTITSNAVTGNWSSGSSWVGGVAPTSADNAVIVSGATITMDVTTGGINTRNSGTTTTVNTGGTFATSVQYINNGTTTINGSFQLNAGGFTNSGNNFVYGAAGKLLFNNTSSYGVNNTDQYWPTASGPVDVTILQGGMTLNSGANRTVTGVFQTAAAVTLTGALTLNGTVRINTGGSFANAPTYGSSSTLVYNTGSTFTRGNEWTTATSGAGYPANVQISNPGTVTTLNMGSTSAQCSGSITVDASTVLNTTSAGLTVVGSVTNNGTISLGGDVTLSGTTASNWVVGASATQTNNGKAVFFTGATANQTITKTGAGVVFFDYLVINKAAGNVTFSSSPATSVTINTTTGDVLQLLNAGALDINGQTLTLNNAGGNISANAASRSITSGVTGATLAITGAKAINSIGGTGTVVINTNVTTVLSAGFDFGVSKVTVNGTLQLNAGGFATNGSAPTYASGSTLLFNTGGNYDVHNGTSDVAGWFRNVASTGSAQAGVPWNVTISNSTSVRYNTANTDNFPRYINGNLVINTGSAFTLGGLSGTAGDFFLRGNWTNSGTFNPNSRQVSFNGALAQTLTGATTFDYLELNNSAGLTLANTIAINQTLTLTSGKITLGANDLTIGSGGNITGASTANYIVAAGTGQLKRTVAGTATLFAVGNTAYNPITFTNSGTSDVYGVRVLNTLANALNATKTVTRSWVTTEAVAGGSNLAVVAQYNTGEPNTGFAAATTPFIGFYNGTSWSQAAATAAGANPFTYTSNSNLSPSDLTTGTQYFAIGKDNAFTSVATNLVITTINPASPGAGYGFSVTVQAQDAFGAAVNVVAGTAFTLTTNGNAGTIGGTVTGTIAAASSSITVSGVTLSTAGTLATLTATRTSGDVLTAGTSSTFTVLAAASQLAFVSVPSTGSAGVNLTSFTVEARRPDNSVDIYYTGNIVISKASGSGILSGTTTVAAAAGVATFSTLQFDLADTYTLNANSGTFSQITSGSIVVSLVPVVLAGWDFFGQSSPTTFAATTFNSNLVSTSSLNTITRGANAASSAGGNSFRTTGFQNDGISTANTDYFQTTLKTAVGYSLNLSTITASVVGTASYSVSPGVSQQFAYSLDGTTFTLIGSPVIVSGATPAAMPSVSTTAVTALQSVPSGTTVYIRYYATGQTNTGGWGFSSATSGTNGLAFSGNIICVQPTAYALTGGGAYCTGGSGVAVGVANSQVGVSYQLKIGGTNTGSPVAGTGSAISFGNQTAAGTYTVVGSNTNGTCNYSTTMTGSVVVTVTANNTIALTSAGGTDAQTVCINTPISNITYATTGATGATVTGLPSGVTGSWSGNVVTISGSPNTNTGSPFTYTVTMTGGCTGGTNTATGTISVNAATSISVDAAPSTQTVYINNTPTNLTVTGSGLSLTYQWFTNGTTNSNSGGTSLGSVNGAQTASYTAPTTAAGTTYYYVVVNGTCGTATSSAVSVIVTTTNTWTGTSSTDWNLAANWSGNVVPGGTNDASIPVVTNYPVLTASSAINNLSIASGATLGIGSNTFTINGAVSGTGTITGSNTSNLVIAGTAGTLNFTSGGTNNYLKDFTINTGASATLGNALNITAYDGVGAEGVLTVTPGGTLASGGFLTIKSNVNGTARIAAGSTSGAYISGNVTVERYIRQNASKSWRLLASNTSGQTINQSWQEGQVGYNVNTNPGFGTMVAGPGASLSAVQAVGYDTLSYGYSMFKYDKTTDNLLPVTNTLTQSLGVEPGFFLFIRGDRGPNQFNTGVGTTPTPPTSATVLRSTGTLFMGDQLAVSTGTPGYAMVRNPYPSRIDMRNIVQGGLLVDAFQVWDPLIGGAYGVGGYQTFFKETDNLDPDFGNYKVTPGGGSYGANLSVQNYIESGAAFFIQSSGGTGTAQVTEACKASGSSNASYRPSAPLAGSQRLTYNVYADNNGSVDIVDGGLVVFNDAYSNAVDNNDVRKSPNFGENIGIIRSNTDLVVEKRQAINGADTVFFNMNQMRETGYRFDVVISGVDPLITGAILQDKYTGTNTALDITGATNAYTFTVDVNAASKAADRFRVVFRQSTVVPVSFISIKAAQAGKNIAVQWNVASEVNVASYEVEKSTDGSRFSKAGTVAAKQAATYNWLDENAVNGSNYYRIKSVDNNGQAKYSSIVKVTIGKAGAVITVSPNPVQGNFINIQFTGEPAGKYGVRLINIAGQVVYNRTMQHAGGSASQTFTLPSALVSGVYQLEILAPDNSRHTEKLIVNAGN